MAVLYGLYLTTLVVLLITIIFNDFKTRQISNFNLICLLFLVIFGWFYQPNWSVLPYTLAILVVGFVLHLFNVLGAGDTKLMCVISLGIKIEFLAVFIYGTVFLGGFFALVYLAYGYCTNLKSVIGRGIPYAVPICISGGVMMLLSHIS